VDAAAFAAELQRLDASPQALAPDERAQLERDGFVVLSGVLDPADARAWADAVERLAGEGAARGTGHVEDLLARDGRFARALAAPRVLAATWHVLRAPFRLCGFSARVPYPGFGAQGLHCDGLSRRSADERSVVTAIWMLDAFDARNGPTRVVPGSQRQPRTPPKALADPAARHPDERRVTGQAGSVLVFDGHLWHSGTRNDGDAPRRSLQVQFVARALAAPTQLPPTPPRELEPRLRALLFEPPRG